MQTDIQIINQGISGLGQNRVYRIDPPNTPLEKYMAANYNIWKRAELTRRRWVFAYVERHKLTQVQILEDVERPYVYATPIDMLRPVRVKGTEWKQQGRFIVSADDDLYIDYIRNVPESEFDPLFVEVLANKIKWESAEYITQSSTKKASAKEDYREAVSEAGKANAFIIGPEDIQDNDEDFSWLRGWHGNG